jgi:diguanylate cyclase (GGDEF)-like protein
MANKKSIAGFINSIENLPTLPGIAMRILEAVQKEEPNIDKISDIFSTDPPLSAKVLKLVNSSFYNLPSKIISVHHAIKMLGIDMVKNLALSFSVVKNYQSKKSNTFDYTCFWKNSLIGALSAKLLTEKLSPKLIDDAFFTGLLQDIGILTLGHCLPKQYSLLLSEMDQSASVSHVAEDCIFGHNHQEIGEHLMKSWGLPETLYIPVGAHHNPENLVSTHFDIQMLTKILHLSSLFIELFNSKSGGLNLWLLNHKIKSYGFKDHIVVDQIAEEIHLKTRQVFPIFEIELENDDAHAQILQVAKEELSKLSADMISNLLAQKNEIEMLKKQVSRDGMTHLYNHHHFREILQREISRAERYKNPLSLIMADIDDFKAINDTFGHIVGDRVIKTVAGCLKQELRQSDYVARYGGEEFAVILPETEINGGSQVAERIREAIDSLRINHEDNSIHVTMSFGIFSLHPGEKISLDELIKKADSALYQAKNQGKNQCCVFTKDQGLTQK